VRLGFYPQPVRTGQAEGAPDYTGSAAAYDTQLSDPRRGSEAGSVPQAGLACRSDSHELPSGTQSDTDATAATSLTRKSYWTCG
jgi:hypothetical protein